MGEKIGITLTGAQLKAATTALEEAGVDTKNVLIADLAEAGQQSKLSHIDHLPSQAATAGSTPAPGN